LNQIKLGKQVTWKKGFNEPDLAALSGFLKANARAKHLVEVSKTLKVTGR
jgi:hypothetical protein